MKNDGVVLLADDNNDDVTLFQRAYKAAGIRNSLRVINDGAQAIEYLKQSFIEPQRFPRPVLLFLDLKTPVLGGFDVLQWVRQGSDIKELPVIVVTTSGSLDDVKKAYALGANSFVIKTLGNHEFVSELEGVKQHWLNG